MNDTRIDAPLALAPARAWRTYLGGRLLDSLRGGGEGEDGHFPEEWIMSVVEARNAGREDVVEGLSRLEDEPGVTLRDLVAERPEAMLGGAHVLRHGPAPGVLVKLIDSAERLTIQVHPDRERARRLFDSAYGKTECWHVLGGRTLGGVAPCVHIGFREGVTRERWRDLFLRQDIAGMLDAMHRFEVEKGETLLIEGGVPHAIGAGCFLAEIQEPTDYTIRIERVTPSGFPVADRMCHQGLGFETMFDCFAYEGVTRDEARRRWFVRPETIREEAGGGVVALLGYGRCGYFRLDGLSVNGSLDFGAESVFSGLYVLEGEGSLEAPLAVRRLSRGAQYFLPAATGAFTIRANPAAPLRLLRFFGPDCS